MRADIREHEGLRRQVHDGIAVLRTQAQQIHRGRQEPLAVAHPAISALIVPRLRATVDTVDQVIRDTKLAAQEQTPEVAAIPRMDGSSRQSELQRALGDLILSSVRWIGDLGYDPLECLDRAIAAQEAES